MEPVAFNRSCLVEMSAAQFSGLRLYDVTCLFTYQDHFCNCAVWRMLGIVLSYRLSTKEGTYSFNVILELRYSNDSKFWVIADCTLIPYYRNLLSLRMLASISRRERASFAMISWVRKYSCYIVDWCSFLIISDVLVLTVRKPVADFQAHYVDVSADLNCWERCTLAQRWTRGCCSSGIAVKDHQASVARHYGRVWRKFLFFCVVMDVAVMFL